MTTMKTNNDALREALSNLEAVLCDPDGRACIHGSAGDLAVIESSLKALRAALAQQPASEASGENFYPNGIAHLIPPITMSVGQLRYAVLGMGGDDNETMLTFQYRQACKDMDGEDAPAGMVCWLHEYPEEGSLHLPQDLSPPWPATPEAAKPEQQAQAGEPEVVAYGTWDSQLGKTPRLMKVRIDNGQDGCTEPLIALQSHREAMTAMRVALLNERDSLYMQAAKKDAALQSCVEALNGMLCFPNNRRENDAGRAAITQAQEALK